MSLQRKEFWVDFGFKLVLVLLAYLWISVASVEGEKKPTSSPVRHEIKP